MRVARVMVVYINDDFGIANMTATMLDTRHRQVSMKMNLHEQCETLGIDLNSSAYKDMFIVSLRSLSDDKHLLPGHRFNDTNAH